MHAGLPPPVPGEPLHPVPVAAAPFHLPRDPADVTYGYGRRENPTWEAFERALGDLEGGEALVFGSGQAAATAVLMTVLRPGDTLAMAADGYYGVRHLVDGHLAGFGIAVTRAPTAGPGLARIARDATLVWLETPSNPGLDVCDVAAIAAEAHAGGALVAVDNTTPTPLGQRPLELGADLSMASDTKCLTGHSDLILGHVATRDPDLLARLRDWRTTAGAIAGAHDVWLAHRSLATLDVRLERACANALAVAEAARRALGPGQVRYPGMPGDPSYELAARQMRRGGVVLTIDLGDEATAEAFIASLRIVVHATSFGGVHSSAERRARWGGDDVSPGLIRLSAGIEDADDLVADVLQAIAASRSPLPG